MTMPGSMLRIRDVSKVYSGGVRALSGVDLDIGPGIFGLLGPNGAGKTTLLRLIATLLKPTEGTVVFDGCDAVRDRKRYRRRLGYLPQAFGLYPNMTAREHLRYYASLKGLRGADAREQVEGLLDEVGLLPVAGDRPVGAFSGGMRQRVGIAGALLGAPDLLVVDEPTAGLDPEERIRFRAILEHASRRAVVVLSTHILQDVELGCSRVAVVADGRVLADAAPEALVAQAKGSVWELDLEQEDLDELRRARPVTSVRELSERAVRVRFTGEPLGWGEVAAEPRLEDAYVDVLRRGRRDAWV